MFGKDNKPSMPPPKLGVMIAVDKSKDKGAAGPKMPDIMGKSHDEPDADQMGGPSDNDADNKIEENLSLIQKVHPAFMHPIGALIEEAANLCRQYGGGGGQEPEGDEAGY